MADIRIKDTDTKAAFASDDEVIMDSPSGTGTMLRDNFIAAVAAIIKAAPETYKLATLDEANKLTSSQDPSQSVSYLGGHDVVANDPALADGSGTAGDTYYVTNPGTRDYGSGNITAAEGDALVYNGSVWQLVEGIANILDGISTAATARTTLGVNSIGENAEGFATKTTGPAMHFDNSASFFSIADDPKLSFTNGTTDDMPFSMSAWIKPNDVANFRIFTKNDGSSTREYDFALNPSGKLSLYVYRDTSNFEAAESTVALTDYVGKWVHVAATYEGAGPNTSNPFVDAFNGINLYVNGVLVSKTNISAGTYLGMLNTSKLLWLGKNSAAVADGEIRQAQIFNRNLSAAEVAQLAKGNDLGFADEFGGPKATSGNLEIGKRYRIRDFNAGDDFTNVGASSNADFVEFVATGTTPTTWSNSSVIESIGLLADFRAERFDLSTNKLYDLTTNAFVATSSGVTLTGKETPIFESAQAWTPTLTFGGASVGMTATGVGEYVRIGSLLFVNGRIVLTAKGSSTGSAVIGGLPIAGSDVPASRQAVNVCYAASMSGLTSPITGMVLDSATSINLFDWGSTGVVALDEGNFSDTSDIRFSAVFEIS